MMLNLKVAKQQKAVFQSLCLTTVRTPLCVAIHNCILLLVSFVFTVEQL